MQGVTFAVWALAAASAAYWGLKLSARPDAGTLAPQASRAALVPEPAAIARLLGESQPAALAPAANLSSRFNLVGLASQGGRTAIAVIAVDGKPARPFRVGSQVDDGLVLQAVEGRRALLGPGVGAPPALALELPPPRK